MQFFGLWFHSKNIENQSEKYKQYKITFSCFKAMIPFKQMIFYFDGLLLHETIFKNYLCYIMEIHGVYQFLYHFQMSLLHQKSNPLNPECGQYEPGFILTRKRQFVSKIAGLEEEIPAFETKKRDKKTTVMLMPDYSAILQEDITRNLSSILQRPRVHRRSSIQMQFNENMFPHSYRSQEQKIYEKLENSCLVKKYLWDFDDDSEITNKQQSMPSQRDPTICRPRQLRGSRVKRNYSGVHHHSINQRVEEQKKFQELDHLNMVSMRPVKKFNKDTESKGTKRTGLTCASNENKVVRDTNVQVWHSKRLKFGSNILKFGVRNKDVIIVVYNQNQQLQVLSLQQDSFFRHPNSCFEASRETQKAKYKWSEFIRSVNKNALIGHLMINEEFKSLKSVVSTLSKKTFKILDFEQDSTTSENNNRKIRVQTRKQSEKEYNVDLTLFEDGIQTSKKDILLDVVDHILDQYAKDSKIKKQGSQHCYSGILRKEKATIKKDKPKPVSQPKQIKPPNFDDLNQQLERSIHDISRLKNPPTFLVKKKLVFERQLREESIFDFIKSFCCQSTPKKNPLDQQCDQIARMSRTEQVTSMQQKRRR